MLKKTLIIALLFGGLTAVSATDANAWIVHRRFAPVRRAVLPPYRVARRVVARPVIRRRPVVYGHPVAYVHPAPVVYGPTVSVGIGVGGYYGW